jgi:hypothetical protein
MKNLLAGLALTLAASARAQVQTPTPKPFLEGQHSGVKQTMAVAVQDEEKWEEVWRKHDASAPAPKVDFSKESVVVVFLGETPTAGIKVTIIVQQDPLDSNRLNVFYRETVSKKGFSAQVQSEPYAMVKVPRADTIDVERDAPVSIPERRQAPKDQPRYDDSKVKAFLEGAQTPSFDGN